MAKKDYYEVLGVSKTSTSKEIKSAFKQLAKKYHPDISKEANAEEKFKEIQEAYAVLSDENKKAQYDQFGHAAFDQMSGAGGGFEGFDFSDIFSDIFGGGFGGGFSSFDGFGSRRTDPNAPQKGRDMEISINLTFKEAAFGVDKEIVLPREQDCKKCNGKGSQNSSDVVTCTTCAGAGRVRQQQRTILGMAVTETVCPDCHGSGQTIKNPCKECSGSGRHVYKDDQKLHIPKGVDNGSYMKVPNKGEGGRNGGPNGDLYLNISVEEDDFFKRDGLDIRVTIPISYSQAALGTKITIPTIYGEGDLTIPKGTQSGSLHIIRGKGIKTDNPQVFGKKEGDQIVKVEVKVPKTLSARERELIEELGTFNDKHTKQNDFFNKVKKFFNK